MQSGRVVHEEPADEGESEEAGSPTLLGPFLSPDPYGAGFVIPGPLTAGPPRPEPEERWTLGPGRKRAEALPIEAQAPIEPVGRWKRLRGLFRPDSAGSG